MSIVLRGGWSIYIRIYSTCAYILSYTCVSITFCSNMSKTDTKIYIYIVKGVVPQQLSLLFHFAPVIKKRTQFFKYFRKKTCTFFFFFSQSLVIFLLLKWKRFLLIASWLTAAPVRRSASVPTVGLRCGFFAAAV